MWCLRHRAPSEAGWLLDVAWAIPRARGGGGGGAALPHQHQLVSSRLLRLVGFLAVPSLHGTSLACGLCHQPLACRPCVCVCVGGAHPRGHTHVCSMRVPGTSRARRMRGPLQLRHLDWRPCNTCGRAAVVICEHTGSTMTPSSRLLACTSWIVCP